jgi:hypothetical protein
MVFFAFQVASGFDISKYKGALMSMLIIITIVYFGPSGNNRSGFGPNDAMAAGAILRLLVNVSFSRSFR